MSSSSKQHDWLQTAMETSRTHIPELNLEERIMQRIHQEQQQKLMLRDKQLSFLCWFFAAAIGIVLSVLTPTIPIGLSESDIATCWLVFQFLLVLVLLLLLDKLINHFPLLRRLQKNS